jgi:hypothetical protein
MTAQNPAPQETSGSSSGIVRALLADRAFLVATAILLTCALTWGIAVQQMGIVLIKSPIPWPEPCVVGSDFRLLSLPKVLGRYEMIPGSDTPIPKETLEQLKIGTSFDKMRLDDRTANWYVRRQYRDVEADANNPTPYDAWYIDVYFYNGGADSVPHIPERCRMVAGISGIESSQVEMDLAGSPLPEAWSPTVPIQRIIYSQELRMTTATRSEYYTFALNGRPESNWMFVRAKMKDIWTEHCYFAKIQFGPAGPGTVEPEESDRRARQFLRDVLPAVLKNLPSVADVAKATEGD